MKIKRVKITNFRSIVETEFFPQEDLTALIGGNESGKSNILKAIIKFFSELGFSSSDRHQLVADDPEIIIEFLLTTEEKNKIAELIGNQNLESLVVSKRGKDRTITNLEIPQDKTDENIQPPEESKEEVSTNPEETPPENVEPTPEEVALADQAEDDKKTESENKNEELPSSSSLSITEQILQMLPVLVAVESVEDLIGKDIVEIQELVKAKEQATGVLSAINSFLSLGNVDLEKLQSKDLPLNEKNKLLLTGSAKAGKKIREYWPQEDLKIHIDTDGNSLAIHVRDGGCLPVKPNIKLKMDQEDIDKANQAIEGREDDTQWIWTSLEERSSGFRWFVTFYSKYLAKVSESSNIILVIDDLGIYLNASIQQVLYTKMMSLTNNNGEIQIIYTTHSPYMLDFSDMKNLLLVEKKENGTKVLEEWWKKKSLKELPQPLQEVGVTRADHILKKKNLLVEGATDVSVIRRLMEMFDLDTETRNALEGASIYPVGGKNESIGVALYCRVDGKKAAILFDSEKEALKLNAKAGEIGIASTDIESLAKPYDEKLFKIESIEDLLPDKTIVEALNIIGSQLLGERWVPIGNLHRKREQVILGIISATKDRLEGQVKEGSLTKEEAELILGSKKAILAEAMTATKLESYVPERKQAVTNVLTNLGKILGNL